MSSTPKKRKISSAKASKKSQLGKRKKLKAVMSSVANSALALVTKTYQRHANATNAAACKKYMRNQFEYYGLKTPQRRLLDKELLGTQTKATKKATKGRVSTIPSDPTPEEVGSIVRLFWEQPQRELQYFAQEYAQKHLSSMPAEFLDTLEFCITNKSWWDTVDMLASNMVGPMITQYPQLQSTMDNWIENENKWLKRSAILFQLKYKKNTDEELLYKYCLKCASHEDFFIRKAIGWALREYSKTDPKSVKKFVLLHDDKWSTLTKTEALKKIKS